MIERAKAEEIQRQKQQGLGRPIISTVVAGQRVVAVKNRLLHSPGWKTFEDFLNDYVRMAFGVDWGNAELKKPLEDRHPFLKWYQKVCDFQKANFAGSGQISMAPANGAMAAYLRLAYDLYALDHNADLQEKLLARLRNNDKFWGARYEVNVAAIFVRAGFTIEFEDESDRSTSHCEFTATHKRTGRKILRRGEKAGGQSAADRASVQRCPPKASEPCQSHFYRHKLAKRRRSAVSSLLGSGTGTAAAVGSGDWRTTTASSVRLCHQCAV